MQRYLISFDDGSMDHIPEEDWPAVGESSRAVVREAKARGSGSSAVGSHASRRASWRPTGRSSTARTRRPRRWSAGSRSSRWPRARRRWRGRPVRRRLPVRPGGPGDHVRPGVLIRRAAWAAPGRRGRAGRQTPTSRRSGGRAGPAGTGRRACAYAAADVARPASGRRARRSGVTTRQIISSRVSSISSTASRRTLLEHALGAQVVPEAVHRRLVAAASRRAWRRSASSSSSAVVDVGDDARRSGVTQLRLVVAHAVDDQLDLVGEVVVHDAVA